MPVRLDPPSRRPKPHPAQPPARKPACCAVYVKTNATERHGIVPDETPEGTPARNAGAPALL